jgi:uncharacterized membrane protein YfhO
MAMSMFIFGIIYIMYNQFPFGDNTIYRMDLYHQYGPLVAELYDRVVQHKSLIYSWTSGGGSGFLGNYFNYLSSPLNILVFLFNKKDVGLAISFITYLRCALSAFTFAYYLRKSKNADSFISSLIAVCYSFCGYFAAYYWNIMWVDGMIMLPLIALGIEYLIDKGDSRLYIASLAIILFSSYYMGFMCCIFSVIYFLFYFALKSGDGNKVNPSLEFDKKYSFKATINNKFINRGFNFAISSLAAAGLCAFALVSVYFILRGSSATKDDFPTTFKSYFDIFDFLTSHLTKVETTIRSSGDNVLPNVYTGILSIILIPLFVASKKISLKEKSLYIIVLVFFLFSFDNNAANFIWHAMHFVNDLPYRYSFIYCFFILVVAYRALENIKSFKQSEITYVAMAWVFFAIIAQKFMTNKMTEVTIYASIAFIILWTAFLIILQKKHVKTSFKALVAFVFIFAEILSSQVSTYTLNVNNTNYNEYTATYEDCIDYIKSKDDGFYRSELTTLDRRMDCSYFGYDGISVFSSMAYEDYSHTQYNLGMYGNRINSYSYNPQTPVYNMMFNLKYFIHNGIALGLGDEYYEKIYTSDVGKRAEVYENKYYLPIAYAAGTALEDWDASEGDPFEVQSDYFSLATGYSGVFKKVDYLNTDFDNLSGDDVTQNGSYSMYKLDEDSKYGYCRIKIAPRISGHVYLYVTSSDMETLEVMSDRIGSFTQNFDSPYILDMGYHNEGEEITVSLDGGASEDDYISYEIYAYSIDDAVFKNGYKKLSESTLNVTEHKDTYLKGEIEVKENSYLYTSIPDDNGWSVYIDGKKAETFVLGDSMLCTTVKPGKHTVEFKFRQEGLIYGAAISAVTLISVCIYFTYKKRYSKIHKSDNGNNELIVE